MSGCTACPNSVAVENTNVGATDWALGNGAYFHEIEGYAGATSVNRGGQITFYVSTASPSYYLQVYRLGWYGGAGARKMAPAVTLAGKQQPACSVQDPATYLLECPWTSSYTLTVPSDSTGAGVWVSGVYLAKLTTADSARHDKYILFVVRDDASTSDLLFNSGSNTYAAYNPWGGKSLYGYNSTDLVAAQKVSLDRPFVDYGGAGHFFQFEYNSLRFLEKNGYWTTYATDVDLHEGTVTLTNHKAFVSMGHNEYWTRPMRDAVTAARDAGVNLGFFNGNSMEWQSRFEPNTLTSTADRTIVEYRTATLDPYDSDPTKLHLVTTLWRNAPVSFPEELLMGAMYSSVVNPNVADYTVQDGTSWVFAGTGLTTGSTIPQVIGREIDHRALTKLNFGVVTLATGTITNTTAHTDHADMTLYQASSGAYVFDAGSLMWPWTLDSWSWLNTQPDMSSALAQQITANVLQKFGATPH